MSQLFNPMDLYSNNKTSSGTSNYWQMPSYNSGASNVYGFQLPDFSGFSQNTRNMGQGMLGSQDTQVGNWLGSYSNAIGNQEKMRAMYSRLSDELGLTGLQRQADTLNAQLEAVPSTYTAATRPFDVNANQLGRIINKQQATLAPLAQRATTQAQNAQNQVATQMGLAQQEQAKELTPYEYERQFLTDRIARETSMFSEANQMEYNGLVAKMQSGVQLNEGEKDRLNQLTIAREQYANQLAIAKLNLEGTKYTADLNAKSQATANLIALGRTFQS